MPQDIHITGGKTGFRGLQAILFDKDGTLFDFAASWSGWAEALLQDLSEGDLLQKQKLAQAIRFDLAAGRFLPSSPVIAGTLEETATLMRPLLPPARNAGLVPYLFETAARAEMVPPVPLMPLLQSLRAQGLQLGVATNDGEAPARAHLTRAGILEQFSHVLGYDSGYTPKPAPDMLLGFSERAGLDPRRIIMVGDSTHDLIAGRAAGMMTVGVLTGLAPASVLAPHADLVLPDIGHLPGILG